MNSQWKIRNKPYEVFSEREKTGKIIQWIRFWDDRIRNRFPYLSEYQDQIGLSITIGSAFGMIFFAVLYITGLIPSWLCIVLNAILASFLHEIEHDLIHNLYYKGRIKVQNFMFWTVWLFRANTINPWFRREIHLLHHKLSGNKEDVEERMIGNGMPFGLKRILIMIDGNLALILQGRKIAKDAYSRLRKIKVPRTVGPYREIFFLLWYSFLLINVFHILNVLFGNPISGPSFLETNRSILNSIAVVYLIPNWIRQTSIQIVSSNMHYYGNIPNVYHQTQVLNSWFVFPFHLFCFNFGATHGIHHFVVNQPFYLRQWTAFYVLSAMERYGIRFNDFQSMWKSNSEPLSEGNRIDFSKVTNFPVSNPK
ncbi:fatty acid desaturase [Leptospira santarosai]|uniref:Stearoyl-CoA 9-desaturase n=1 Tax=Leptospira santarosai serovar Arenal str. MAVJ 401 TaxID=1049976 RepID=M6JDK6_9LEPT|nr:fatty acid desaturase [Leptospira santarosai]EKS07036.1 stearoyl-CoA 9-desaturase [Leptospira santarosai str. JET]EMM85914.1 stearoyl-CoA 9-desaturase [Leptospira santarosai str. 2000027870]EMN20009.1 stearoyl-CoA 9-desaturase [Leptospira santarosai serovar Arenal str. MAVJ 401]EMO83168.1 stearoyl-CoA 9-desaturase [Leptospira santarosai str. AIM]EMP04190.1 stearoyl-CoA 9-desaturase [Leptospira santarosai str. HAI1380]